MIDKRCSKNFPKDFVKETQMNTDGYPKYKRRMTSESGVSFTMEKNGNTIEIDNGWAAPYSPLP